MSKHLVDAAAELRRRKRGYEYLEQERIASIRSADTIAGVRQLAGLAKAWVFMHGTEPTSGLLEMYKHLAKGRK